MATPAQPASNNTTNAAQSTPATASTDVVPHVNTLVQVAKLAIEQDRAIMLDYYRSSINNTAFIGEDKETKERILVKTKEEFTSLIKKIYKVGDDFIVMTENSLYVVSNKIQKRGVNLASLHDSAYDN